MDIHDRLTFDVERAKESPEAYSVLVVTGDEDIAREAGPKLAKILYPDREFGEVLYLEYSTELTGFMVAVKDNGPSYSTTKADIRSEERPKR